MILDKTCHNFLVAVHFFELFLVICDDNFVVVLIDALERAKELQVFLASFDQASQGLNHICHEQVLIGVSLGQCWRLSFGVQAI